MITIRNYDFSLAVRLSVFVEAVKNLVKHKNYIYFFNRRRFLRFDELHRSTHIEAVKKHKFELSIGRILKQRRKISRLAIISSSCQAICGVTMRKKPYPANSIRGR